MCARHSRGPGRVFAIRELFGARAPFVAFTMVSFSCEVCCSSVHFKDGLERATVRLLTTLRLRSQACGEIYAKKKLDQHARQCRGATFTCLDCMRWFPGSTYREHTSCISEAQKYQGALYKEKANKSEKRKSMNGADSKAMIPRNAYVEDAVEGADDSQAVAVVDVPPRAPTPPSASELPANVNVFDFLVSEETPKGSRKQIHGADGSKMIEERSMPGQFPGNGADSQYSQYSQYSNGDGSYYMQNGFSYGHAPLAPEFARYDSYNNLIDSQNSQAALMPPPPPYVTPAPKEHRKEKSEKKRKRHVEDLDLTSSAAKRPSSRDEMMVDAPKSTGRVLHSGLTGGLSKLVTDKDFYDDRIEAGPTPVSPIKRSKRGDDKDKKDKADRRKSSYTSYSTTTSKTPSSGRHADERREKHRSHRSLSPQQSQKYTSHRIEDDRHRHSRAPRDSFSSQDTSRPKRQQLRQIDYPTDRPASVQPTAANQLSRSNGGGNPRADLFMSFVTKGPESERGYSINKLLKRYHRERDVRGEEEKGEEDKELWRGLRLRRNSRGEVVLFAE